MAKRFRLSIEKVANGFVIRDEAKSLPGYITPIEDIHVAESRAALLEVVGRLVAECEDNGVTEPGP